MTLEGTKLKKSWGEEGRKGRRGEEDASKMPICLVSEHTFGSGVVREMEKVRGRGSGEERFVRAQNLLENNNNKKKCQLTRCFLREQAFVRKDLKKERLTPLSTLSIIPNDNFAIKPRVLAASLLLKVIIIVAFWKSLFFRRLRGVSRRKPIVHNWSP